MIAAILTGTVIGLAYGVIFTRFGVPSFVITLAGLLGILGLQLYVLGKEGSLNIAFTSALVEFAQQQFLAPAVAYGLVVLTAVAYLVSRLRSRARRAAAGLSTTPAWMLTVHVVALALVSPSRCSSSTRTGACRTCSSCSSCSWCVMDLAIRRTGWGRSVMAVGGNVEAARRAGINVRFIYLSVFALCSTFAALGGILRGGPARGGEPEQRRRRHQPQRHRGGGHRRHQPLRRARFGVLGPARHHRDPVDLQRPVLLNLDSSIRFMVTGAVLLLAVTIDSLSRRSRAAHGRA